MTRPHHRRIRILILGAAGRDFHNFNVVFRDDNRYEVVGFTAAQIPNIADRVYPPSLAGPLYPEGLPIHDEAEMAQLVADLAVDRVVFAYSDVPYRYVMTRASIAGGAGADFWLLGPKATMLRSRRPVVAVCAVRTGAGKSQTTRVVAAALRARGLGVAIVRHPMPYGDLEAMAVQRFATRGDLDAAGVTIEEREEYEPHLAAGSTVHAGVDYEQILRQAEEDGDVILWDGGNNDFPFYEPDVLIVVLDPLRAGDELTYYPGGMNLRAADIAVINKVDSATADQVATVRRHLRAANPTAVVVEAESAVTVDRPSLVKGHRVVVIEDGPTLTHGGMAFGAGLVAAKRYGAAEIVDPRPYAVGTLATTVAQYPDSGPVLPAMGYSRDQVADLEATINAIPADAVLVGTPIDLGGLVQCNKPLVRVRYDLVPLGGADLGALVFERLPLSPEPA